MNTSNERITQLHAILLTHFTDKEEYSLERYRFANDDYWSLADLIARQYLNNGHDGFDTVNVGEGYRFIVENKNELKEVGMLSKTGTNNAGILLWDNWEVE